MSIKSNILVVLIEHLFSTNDTKFNANEIAKKIEPNCNFLIKNVKNISNGWRSFIKYVHKLVHTQISFSENFANVLIKLFFTRKTREKCNTKIRIHSQCCSRFKQSKKF